MDSSSFAKVDSVECFLSNDAFESEHDTGVVLAVETLPAAYLVVIG